MRISSTFGFNEEIVMVIIIIFIPFKLLYVFLQLLLFSGEIELHSVLIVLNIVVSDDEGNTAGKRSSSDTNT